MHASVLPDEFQYIDHILIVVVQRNGVGSTDKVFAKEEIDFIDKKNPTRLSKDCRRCAFT